MKVPVTVVRDMHGQLARRHDRRARGGVIQTDRAAGYPVQQTLQVVRAILGGASHRVATSLASKGAHR